MNICLDTETTGLNPSFDEILQLSIIDSNTNEVLFNDYFKPQYTVCWDEAQRVHQSGARVLCLPQCDLLRKSYSASCYAEVQRGVENAT